MSASIHDVAKYSGVSTATVSRALRGLPNVSPRTRAIVQSAAADLGYVPSPSASGLSGGRHHVVAIVIPSTARWFYSRVIEGVDSVLRQEGFDTFLIILSAGPTDRERLFHNSLLRKRVDAVIALGIDFTADERRELRSLKMPATIVGGPVRGVRSVGLDDAAVGRVAVEHLLSLGHREIGHLGGENEYGMDQSVGLARSKAWRVALERHGLDPRPEWLVLGAFLMPQAKVAAAGLLRSPHRPTALFAASDEMAMGVMLAAADLGIDVPGELSVIGVDDHDWSESFGLTTIRQNPYEQGRTAARAVLDGINGIAPPSQNIRAPFELIVRRSTAAPPAAGTRATTDPERAVSPAPL